MPNLAEILKDPNYVNANAETKRAIFDRWAPQDTNYSSANEATQQAIRARFGIEQAAPVAEEPVSEVPKGRKRLYRDATDFDYKQGVKDVLAGAVRGAGSIGSTLIRPFESAEANQERRSKIDQALQQLTGANPESGQYQAGKLGAEIAGTAGIGGAVAAPLRMIPGLAPVAEAAASGGFRTGINPVTLLDKGVNMLAKAAGGAIAGGAGAGLVNPEEAGTGALVGAAIPTVAAPIVAQMAKGVGWLWDALKGQVGEVNAARIARQVAGGDINAIRAANAAAEQGLTSGQAAAGVDNAAWQALQSLAQRQNPGNYYSRLEGAQDVGRVNELARLAGGATQTEAMANRLASKAALGRITTPMRETELGAANIAGQLKPGLEAEATRLGNAAASKVEDVRRFSGAADRATELAKTWEPTARQGPSQFLRYAPDHPGQQYTYPGKLALSTENQAVKAAEDSLRLGEGARFAQARADSLAAHGLKPLDTNAIVGDLLGKLNDPAVGVSDVNKKVLTAVGRKINEWVDRNGGVIDAKALYEIRKNTVNEVIEKLLPSADKSTQAQRAAGLLAEVRPLIDDAIEKAGGTGWRDYLKTFEAGMHSLEQRKMAAVAAKMYKESPERFIALIEGNDPKAVEKVFGPGSFDIVKEMGSKLLPLERIAGEVSRDIKIGKQAQQGGEALANILQENTPRFNLPPLLSTKIAIARQGLREFEGRVQTSTLKALAEGMKSGKNANEMLDLLPAKERIKVLNIMQNSQTWSPLLAPLTVQGSRNALSSEPNQNALAQ